MKKRTSILAIENQPDFNYSDLSTPEVLERFLTEKKATNLSANTISLSRFHAGVYIGSLGEEAKKPVYLTCDRDHYNRFILHLQSLGKKRRFHCQYRKINQIVV